MSKRSRQIVKKLSLEEKCALCGQDEGSFGAVPRLGLEGIVPEDNPGGGLEYFPSGKEKRSYQPVSFPSNACLGMSWDTGLLSEVGECMAILCRANPKPVTWLFRPGANIRRSPLCGRNFEYFSEDPCLSGMLAAAYIRGLQSLGVAATLKHYLCNSQEMERMTTNAVVSQRALREIYAKSFQIAIENGNPWSVMSSYNKLNGEWVNESETARAILRDEIGYKGLVVSDFAAVHKNKLSASGLDLMDLELAPTKVHAPELLSAVRSGTLSEDCLFAPMDRLFSLMEKVDPSPLAADMEELHQKAKQAAEAGICLLKNESVLPLSSLPERVSVLGAMAEEVTQMGGGSGHMIGYRLPTYLTELKKRAGAISYAPGYPISGDFPPQHESDEELIGEAVRLGSESDLLIVFAGLPYPSESEGYDRSDLDLPKGQGRLLRELTKLNRRMILILTGAGPVDISDYEPFFEAVLYVSLGGEAVAEAAVSILFGEAEPGGRLTETWPRRLSHSPAYLNFPTGRMVMPDVVYAEDIFVGYRWYEKRGISPLYPFGHGLSYTSFEITEPGLTRRVMKKDQESELTLCVTNTGRRSGSTVVQLYIARVSPSRVARPVKELKGFSKVFLKSGQSKHLHFLIRGSDLSFYSEERGAWLVEEGSYELLAGFSSEQIAKRIPLRVSEGDVLFTFDEMTPLFRFLEEARYYEILREMKLEGALSWMNQKENEWLCLMRPLPFYRLSEPLMGEPVFDGQQIAEILKRMNEEN